VATGHFGGHCLLVHRDRNAACSSAIKRNSSIEYVNDDSAADGSLEQPNALALADAKFGEPRGGHLVELRMAQDPGLPSAHLTQGDGL